MSLIATAVNLGHILSRAWSLLRVSGFDRPTPPAPQGGPFLDGLSKSGLAVRRSNAGGQSIRRDDHLQETRWHTFW
jgi:hypothetical protein